MTSTGIVSKSCLGHRLLYACLIYKLLAKGPRCDRSDEKEHWWQMCKDTVQWNSNTIMGHTITY